MNGIYTNISLFLSYFRGHRRQQIRSLYPDQMVTAVTRIQTVSVQMVDQDREMTSTAPECQWRPGDN